MNKTNVYIVLAGMLIISGCSLSDIQKPKIPSWSVQLEVPLTKQSIELNSLLEDSLLTKIPTGENGDSIYSFQESVQIDRIEVGDRLSMDDVQESFIQSIEATTIDIPAEQFSQAVDTVTVNGSTQNFSSEFSEIGIDPITDTNVLEIGLIELGDIPQSTADPYQLNNISPGINSIPNGTNDSIPVFAITPTLQPFAFDDFSQAVFSSGQLEVKIENNMPIILGSPLIIQFQQVVGIDTIDIPGAIVQFNAGILPNSTGTEYMDLSGITLPGDIFIEVSGSSSGTAGEIITINDSVKQSSFVTRIAAVDLLVSSATAKIPANTLLDTGSVVMADSETKVVSAIMNIANIDINVQNDLALDANLDIVINSIENTSGTAFTRTISLAANSSSNNSYVLDDYSLIMDLDSQQVNYEVTVNTVSTDPLLATITSSDVVAVEISLYGASIADQITFDRMTGIVEQQQITDSGSIAISSDSKIMSAEISSGSLLIQVENNVNEPGYNGLPELSLTIPEFQDVNGNPLEFIQPQILDAGFNDILFDLAGYIMVFPDTSSPTITYTTEVTTPFGEIGRYNLQDSILTTIDIGTINFSSVTGYFVQEDIVEENVIQIDNPTKIDQALIDNGDLTITITNDVGVIASVEFIIDELTNGEGTLNRIIEIDPSQPQTSVSIPLQGYTMDLDLGLQEINYTSVISLDSTQNMTMVFGNYISVQVELSNLNFSEVSGYISHEGIIQGGTIQLDDSTKVDIAEINQGNLTITVDNNIGVVADVLFTVDEIVDSNGQPFSRNIILIPNATEPSTVNVYSLAGYAIDLDIEEQAINYHSTITLPDTTLMSLVTDNNIQVSVDLTDLMFASVSGIIDPMEVEIEKIEESIDALPDEFNGIEFAEVNMTMDFNTNIGVPVLLDLVITAKNVNGDSVSVLVNEWNISDSSMVVIPDAEKLINIKPELITATGKAIVGEGGTFGIVASNQFLEGEFNISAPLKLYLTEDSQIDFDPEAIATEDFPDELESMILFAEYENQFEFGVQLELLAAADSNYFQEGNPISPDRLITMEILPNQTGIDSTALGSTEIALFGESDTLYLKTQVSLVGMENEFGENIPSSFISTDSLNLLLYGAIQVLIDPERKDEE